MRAWQGGAGLAAPNSPSSQLIDPEWTSHAPPGALAAFRTSASAPRGCRGAGQRSARCRHGGHHYRGHLEWTCVEASASASRARGAQADPSRTRSRGPHLIGRHTRPHLGHMSVWNAPAAARGGGGYGDHPQQQALPVGPSPAGPAVGRVAPRTPWERDATLGVTESLPLHAASSQSCRGPMPDAAPWPPSGCARPCLAGPSGA